MALPTCSACEDAPSVLVATRLDTGDAITLCQACLPAWLTVMVQVTTGVDVGAYIAEQIELADREETGEVTANPDPPARPPAERKRLKEQVAKEAGHSPPTSPAPPTDDGDEGESGDTDKGQARATS